MHGTTGIVKKHATTEGKAVRPEIREIFADIFQFGEGLHFHTSYHDVEKWDSL